MTRLFLCETSSLFFFHFFFFSLSLSLIVVVVVVTRGGCEHEHFLRARANGRRCFFLSFSFFLSLDDGEGSFFNAMWSAVVTCYYFVWYYFYNRFVFLKKKHTSLTPLFHHLLLLRTRRKRMKRRRTTSRFRISRTLRRERDYLPRRESLSLVRVYWNRDFRLLRVCRWIWRARRRRNRRGVRCPVGFRSGFSKTSGTCR